MELASLASPTAAAELAQIIGTLGACTGHPGSTFFPDDEDGPEGEAAKRICRGCAVVGHCLTYALATRPPIGIWGAMSTAQRAAL